MGDELLAFARRVASEKRQALGAVLVRKLREGRRQVTFEDAEIRPFLIDVELAEKLESFVEEARVK